MNFDNNFDKKFEQQLSTATTLLDQILTDLKEITLNDLVGENRENKEKGGINKWQHLWRVGKERKLCGDVNSLFTCK